MGGNRGSKVVKLHIVGDAYGIAQDLVEAQGFKGASGESIARLAVSMARREGVLSMIEAQFRAEIMAALTRTGYSSIVSVSALRWGRDPETGQLVERKSSAEADGLRIDLQELERLLEEKTRAVLEVWLQDRLPMLLRIVREGRGSSRAPAWVSFVE